MSKKNLQLTKSNHACDIKGEFVVQRRNCFFIALICTRYFTQAIEA